MSTIWPDTIQIWPQYLGFVYINLRTAKQPARVQVWTFPEIAQAIRPELAHPAPKKEKGPCLHTALSFGFCRYMDPNQTGSSRTGGDAAKPPGSGPANAQNQTTGMSRLSPGARSCDGTCNLGATDKLARGRLAVRIKNCKQELKQIQFERVLKPTEKTPHSLATALKQPEPQWT